MGMKSFSVPVFKSHIYYTSDPSEAQEWLDKRRFDSHVSDEDDGFCNTDNGQILIFIKNDDPALLAHECLHAVYRILEYSSIESRDEELIAYLLEWTVGECLRAKPTKSKVDKTSKTT